MGPGSTLTIEAVLQEFLAEQAARLSHERAAEYRGIVELLKGFLDGYWPGHDQAEYNRVSAAGGSFCTSFGPDEMLEAYGEFLGYYMTRKVIAGKETLRLAGTVTKKLAAWLAGKGYVRDADDAQERAKRAAKELPAFAEAEKILREYVEADPPGRCSEEIEDHFSVTHLQPGKVWLAPLTGSPDMVGPIRIPEIVSQILQENWDIGGVVGRNREGWIFLEVWNISG
jgi:hypothetical protein